MGLPSIFVYTHDSIGLGEDGPTHQPIEQLAALRAMPGLSVVRPADANETALAWRYAIAATDEPDGAGALAPGRPDVEPGGGPRRRDRARRLRAARLVKEPDARPDPDRDRLRGPLCRAAADVLEAEGIATRVVSMPCMEHFAARTAAYRDEVLPPACRARVAVEAAQPFGWHRWIGDRGEVIGMETFGASGPAGACTSTSASRPSASPRRSRRREASQNVNGGQDEHRDRGQPATGALTEAGVSVWLDQIRRSLIESGELARMVAEDSLRGVTSNPSIFEKAILGSKDYDDELLEYAREQLGAVEIYDRIAVATSRSRPTCCAACTASPTARRLRVARGRARSRARHRGARSRRRALLEAR